MEFKEVDRPQTPREDQERRARKKSSMLAIRSALSDGMSIMMRRNSFDKQYVERPSLAVLGRPSIFPRRAPAAVDPRGDASKVQANIDALPEIETPRDESRMSSLLMTDYQSKGVMGRAFGAQET
eukprot:3729147-Prymnesium_polylepis.1